MIVFSTILEISISLTIWVAIFPIFPIRIIKIKFTLITISYLFPQNNRKIFEMCRIRCSKNLLLLILTVLTIGVRETGRWGKCSRLKIRILLGGKRSRAIICKGRINLSYWVIIAVVAGIWGICIIKTVHIIWVIVNIVGLSTLVTWILSLRI